MKRVLISASVLALAVTGISQASATPAVYKVTGGGQTLVPAGGGAGNTIAFSAQSQGEMDPDAKGQFQFVDRGETGSGKGQTTYHGDVTCVVVFTPGDGGTAVIGGETRDGLPFRIDVTDNAAGGDDLDDMILVRKGADATGGDSNLCDQDDAPDEDELFALSRGNVTIHKGK